METHKGDTSKVETVLDGSGRASRTARQASASKRARDSKSEDEDVALQQQQRHCAATRDHQGGEPRSSPRNRRKVNQSPNGPSSASFSTRAGKDNGSQHEEQENEHHGAAEPKPTPPSSSEAPLPPPPPHGSSLSPVIKARSPTNMQHLRLDCSSRPPLSVRPFSTDLTMRKLILGERQIARSIAPKDDSSPTQEPFLRACSRYHGAVGFVMAAHNCIHTASSHCTITA